MIKALCNIKNHYNLNDGWMLCKEMIGFQASIVWCAAHTSQNLVLLLDHVKEVGDLKENEVPTVSCILNHLQKCTETEVSQENAAERTFEANVTLQSMETNWNWPSIQNSRILYLAKLNN